MYRFILSTKEDIVFELKDNINNINKEAAKYTVSVLALVYLSLGIEEDLWIEERPLRQEPQQPQLQPVSSPLMTYLTFPSPIFGLP